jgi:hypothetical protein
MICEQWSMELPEPVPGDPWFVDWALRSPKQAGQHLTAGFHAYTEIKDIQVETAVEYFGGIGAQALMIESIFAPKQHLVMDWSIEATAHLKNLGLNALQADSYRPRNTVKADLVGLDFGDLTVWKTRQGDHAELLDRVFLLEPKAVVLTDVAGPHLHLHRERYEALLGSGSCVDYPTYLQAFADLIAERWGYELQAGFYHRWSTVMALVPQRTTGKFEPTPATPVGLELL